MRLSFPRSITSPRGDFSYTGARGTIAGMKLTYAFTLIFGLQFAVLHVLAEKLSLYWRYPWLDVPMHVFGGVLLMLVIATLVEMRVVARYVVTGWRLPVVLSFVLIAWEVFGIYRYQGIKPGFVGDTTLDIIFGVIGIVLGYFLARALARMV